MSAFKHVSNPQTVTPGNSSAHTFVTESPRPGRTRWFAITVTVGSVKFNTGGAILSETSSCVAGESSEKVVLECRNPDTLFNFQGAGTTDSFIVSEV
jgi:hypothetical protein